MIELEKGAKVKVRLHTGEVVDAVYAGASTYVEKHHWILIDGFSKVMGDFRGSFAQCRLIGNPCVLVPVGVSV
jgi:ribosomal protein S12